MNYCFGADIGGTTVKLGLFEDNGTLIEKWEIKTRVENEGEAILPDISEDILKKMVEREIAAEDVIGIGVGIPAPVTEDGIVNGTVNIGWKHKEVIKDLGDLTGLKVCASNDANVAALGEMWKGAGAGEKNMVMVTLGTGIGGGIIVNGKLLAGANGGAGEIGHMCVNFGETETCGCGRKGCLEQYASASGIVRIAKIKLFNEKRKTMLNADTVTAKEVFDCVKAGDKAAIEIAEEFGEYLGRGLANMAVIVDPSLIVIGGGVSRAGTILFDFIEKNYRKYAFFANRNVRFVLAALGNDAGIYGCAKLVLENK